MTSLLKFIYRLVLTGLVIVLAVGFLLTFRANRSQEQKTFAAANVPNPLPDGYYRLQIGSYKGFWRGKEFNAARGEGINTIRTVGKEEQRYPFRSYISRELNDAKIEVLKVDYNLPENPFWLKPVLEEIVEAKDGEYLGKISYQFLPGIPFALGFYTLKPGKDEPKL